jgi:predicted nucleic acid-binding protein
LIAPDTSVLVAGFDEHHPHFDIAAQALSQVARDGRLITQTIAELYSTLTITSGLFNVDPSVALEYTMQFCQREPVGLPPAGYRQACEALAANSIRGRAIYDGLIALAAKHADLVLLSLDRRARPVYEACGARFEILI